MTPKDFDVWHLTDEQREIAQTILKAANAEYSGGCRAFYTPDEWKDKGEEYGLNSVLIVVHDGGDLSPVFGIDGDPRDVWQALTAKGFWFEPCTCWYSAIYDRDPAKADERMQKRLRAAIQDELDGFSDEWEVDTWDDPGDYPNNLAAGPLASTEHLMWIEDGQEHTLKIESPVPHVDLTEDYPLVGEEFKVSTNSGKFTATWVCDSARIFPSENRLKLTFHATNVDTEG